MSELKKIDTVVGDGKEAAAGNHVDVHYTQGGSMTKTLLTTKARSLTAH